jgi:hypothetical protein
VVSGDGLLLIVVIVLTQVKAADPIPLPVRKKRHTPTSPLLTSGEIEGRWHPSRSEITSFGFPLSHVGKETAEIAVVSFVPRHFSESNEIGIPVGFWQLLSENSCIEP